MHSILQYIYNLIPSYVVIFGPSPINWCEPDNFNYFIGPFKVLEFHNTLTNASYVIGAAFLILNYWFQPKLAKSSVFYFYCFSLFCTGISSAAFHANLTWITQKLDEIFETWAVITLFQVFGFTSLHDVEMRIFLHCVVATICIWLIPKLFNEIHIFIISVATVALSHYSPCLSSYEKNIMQYVGVVAGFGFYCWMLDVFNCDLFQRMLLHAYGWHICTGLALCNAGIALYYRLDNESKKNQIKLLN